MNLNRYFKLIISELCGIIISAVVFIRDIK